MSLYSITNYYNELEKIIHYGGSKKETAIRNAFYNLLNDYARSKDLMLIAEISTKNKQGRIITPDGTIKDSIRNDWGYWESKDESDDINEEIRNKFSKGYPSDNILFEDSQTAVLYQHGDEVMRVNMREDEQLHEVLTEFLKYERPEVQDFREAIEKFKEDIPKVTAAIRDIIEAQQQSNADMQKAEKEFLELCKASINPSITADDVKEMMIQHILSADIFNTIFDEPHFHQENNIARELNKVIETFFTGAVRRQTLGSIKHYYDTINARAASIADHHEKQKFLKVVYENFYKGYNPKAADRLGIVYTPNEIVQFMIRSTDYLLHKHFGKTLGDKNVEILDPATGTGTFICDIIDYLPAGKLANKYKNELHANEVAILPYYIANLNIEYTYKQKTGQYAEFDNLCFVDTLDNTGFHWAGKQGDLFGVSAENAQRIRRQNERKISVIIGNPPYNANQQNENDNNKNKVYKEIDKRIKDTYIKNSTAQKTKLYDMYSRFYRWASDRIMDDGVICFISNNSYVTSKAFDGFRKSLQDEFQYVYIIDLGGNIRELSGRDGIFLNEKHTIFGKAAAVGIAMGFLIKDKRRRLQTAHINYIHPCDIRATRDAKLEWLISNPFENIEFNNIIPDKNNNWFSDVDYEKLIPVADKNVKAGKENSALFKLFCWGNSSNRDEWVYDLDLETLGRKINYFIAEYNKLIGAKDFSFPNSIKWSRDLKKKFALLKTISFDNHKMKTAFWRPFTKVFFYSEKVINDVLTQNHIEIFGANLSNANKVMMITNHPQIPFVVHSVNKIADAGYGSRATQNFPLYRYTSTGERIDNITDWGLQQFTVHYKPELEGFLREATKNGLLVDARAITKEDVFHYVYAVLHNPAYSKKYELNLKREFPRIPFYDNFFQWTTWGKQLMDLHINYETVEPYDLTTKTIAPREQPKAKLKALRDIGVIQLDENTELHGIPKQAWKYKLGNRSALEWILDQYKEKKPSDPTIAEKFNTYRFADYKEHVIDLLKRVCTVSVETIKVVREMEN